MKTLAFTILISLLAINPATAKVYNCTFETFTQLGMTQDRQSSIVASYTGEKFHLNTEKKLIQRGWAKGWAKPDKILEVQKSANFTAYVWFRNSTDVRGKTLKRRYSYRIYKDGRASAHVSVQTGNYGTLKASGTCS